MAKKNELATARSTEVVQATAFEQFASAGLENVGAKDLLVPRLAILQDLSPQVKKTKAEYIDGAAVGMICDVGTGELMPETVIYLPVFYQKAYLEWMPRDSGGGLANIHPDASILDQCTPDDKNKPHLPNGNYIAETAQFFGFNLSVEGGRRSFIPMTSTQLKRARKWLTLATGEKLKRANGSTFTPPLWYRTYELSTVLEQKNKDEWFGWKVERGLTLPEWCAANGHDFQSLLDEAVEFHRQLSSGEAKADVRDLEQPVDAEGAM